jgi:hypothetical protein
MSVWFKTFDPGNINILKAGESLKDRDQKGRDREGDRRRNSLCVLSTD